MQDDKCIETNAKKSDLSSEVPSSNAHQEVAEELQLQLCPGASHSFKYTAAKPCEVDWDISQVGTGSEKFASGETKIIRLSVPQWAQPHALIRGEILILDENATVLRCIPVGGWVRMPQTETPPIAEPKVGLRSVAILVSVLGVAAILFYWLYALRPPTLIISPAQLDLGTLYYSPPVGGSINTNGVFTVKWRGTSPGNVGLNAQEIIHCTDQTGHEVPVFATNITFQIGNDGGEVLIPLQCQDLSNEIDRVSITVTLSTSNSPIRVTPSQLSVAAVIKPAPDK